MENSIKEVLYSEEVIANKIIELGNQIENDYKDVEEDIVFIGILKGASIFLSDLVRKISIPVKLDFMAVSSYGMSFETSGVVKILKDLDSEIEGKHIIIVEDIIDTGLTLDYLINLLKVRKPKSIRICTLLNKEVRRKVDLDVDYIGFEVPDGFIVGYGIDYAEKYRNLPYIGVIDS